MNVDAGTGTKRRTDPATADSLVAEERDPGTATGDPGADGHEAAGQQPAGQRDGVDPGIGRLADARRWMPWLLWLGFVAIAAGTLISWQAQGLYRVVGDEPHYLVMADGILVDRTFEQTATYERDFTEQVIYPGGLAPAGSTAVPENTHAVLGPNGLYNVHNIGLPLLLVAPWAVGGVTATKLLLVLIVSLVVPFAWRFSGRFTTDTRIRAASTVATTYSLPFLLGANQIFPDLPAGVLALIGIDRVFAAADARASAGSSTSPAAELPLPSKARLFADAVGVLAIAYMPWLQIKFTAAMLLVVAALAIEWKRSGLSSAGIAARLTPVGGSLGLLATYNLHAFGKASGPYADGALELSVHSMAVLAGLHLDRFQGVLVQNPVYLAGVLFVVPFVRRAWVPGGLVVLAYASFVVPNALHPVWYGGSSFAGRFFWSGAVVAIPAVIYGLVRLANLARPVWLALTGLSLLATSLTWTSLLVGPGDVYNRDPNLRYPSLLPIGDRFLPAFRDPELAFRLGVNLAFLALAVGLVATGFLTPAERDVRQDPRRWRRTLAGVVGAWAGIVLIAGLIGPYEEERPLTWAGAELPGDIGAIDGPARTATPDDGPGFVSYGPFVGIWLDEYEYRIELEADRADDLPVGFVEVFSSQTATVLATHEVPSGGSGEPLVITGRVSIPAEIEEHLLEVRTYYHGEGRLTVKALELDAAS